MAKFIFRRDEIDAFKITEKEIKAKVMADLDRRVQFGERKNILKDHMKPIIDKQLSYMFSQDTYQDMRPYIDVTNNLMRRVIREISNVYSEEPARMITPKSAQKRFEETIAEINYNEKLARGNYLLNGMNDLLFQVVTLGGGIDINILTPDMITVFENQDNPTVLDAVLIEDYYYDAAGTKITQWIYWSPTRHFIVDKDFKIRSVDGNEGLENPYRAINIMTDHFYPFVDVHASDRENCFFDAYTGMDLVEATKLIAIQSTFRNFMIPMQFKQIAVKMQGVDEGKTLKNNQVKSPQHILTGNGDMQVLDWQSDLKQIGEQIQNQIFAVASNYGISAENFKLSAAPVSGFARMVAKERLMEIREEQIKIWRTVEERLFDAIRTANNLYSIGNQIPESAKFAIDFAEPRGIEDPMAMIQIVKEKMQLGIINLLQVIKDENPDLKTDDDAEEFLNKNIEIRNRLSRRFGFNFDELLKTNGQAAQRQGAFNG